MRRAWALSGACALLAVALGRRPARRAFIGVYHDDGLLSLLAPESPAGLVLRAAAGDVIRALAPAQPGGSA